MSHLLIAATAALGACLLLLVGVLLGLLRRSGGRVEEVERRLDALAADLGGAVVRAEEAGRRSRLLGDITGSIDLDEVLARALEAIAAVPGVDAALLRVDGPEGPPAIAALGIPDEEAARQATAVLPGQRDVRAVELTTGTPRRTKWPAGTCSCAAASPSRSRTRAGRSGRSSS